MLNETVADGKRLVWGTWSGVVLACALVTEASGETILSPAPEEDLLGVK